MKYVDEDRLLAALTEVDAKLRKRGLKGDARRDAELRAVRDFLAGQPETAPLDVVGVAEAADIMGVAKQRIYRYDEQGRMPDPLRPNPEQEQLASGPLYPRTGVITLAEDIREERDERERRRQEREQEAAAIARRRAEREARKENAAV